MRLSVWLEHLNGEAADLLTRVFPHDLEEGAEQSIDGLVLVSVAKGSLRVLTRSDHPIEEVLAARNDPVLSLHEHGHGAGGINLFVPVFSVCLREGVNEDELVGHVCVLTDGDQGSRVRTEVVSVDLELVAGSSALVFWLGRSAPHFSLFSVKM